MRITNSIVFDTALGNLQKQSQRLFRTQEEATSGKKVLRPSDDPISTQRILDFRGELSTISQHQSNQEMLTSFLNATETAFQGLETVLHRARELTLAGLSDGATAEDREVMAKEVRELVDQAILLGNTEVAGRFIFAGSLGSHQPPYSETGQFSGNGEVLSLEIASGQTMPMNILGSTLLSSDLQPGVDADTPLSSLQNGNGVSPGFIRVTDRAGNSDLINLASATTLDDVISAISGSSALNVTAAINASGTGLTIVDQNLTPIQNLVIEEVGAATTASDLGILADVPGDIVGSAVQPAIVPDTPVALLHEGEGVTLSTIRITNGAVEEDVNLSGATTIGDIITTINASGANVTASLNASGKALEVRSNDPATVAVVTDNAGVTTAADLGIQGGKDILKTLLLLSQLNAVQSRPDFTPDREELRQPSVQLN